MIVNMWPIETGKAIKTEFARIDKWKTDKCKP